MVGIAFAEQAADALSKGGVLAQLACISSQLFGWENIRSGCRFRPMIPSNGPSGQTARGPHPQNGHKSVATAAARGLCAMARRPKTPDEHADALAARLTKMLDNERLLLKLAAESSKLTPHARTALRLTLLEIANRLERYALLFEVGDKKPDSEPGQFEHDPGNRIPATTPRPVDLFRALEPTSARPRRRCHERDEGHLRSGP